MTVLEFRAFFPAFENVGEALIQQQLTLSLNHLDSGRFGDFYAEATACWVAHHVVTNMPDNAGEYRLTVDANDVIHRKTETIEIARDPLSLGKQMSNPLLRTTWGQRFQYLSDICGVGAVAVGGC